MEERDCVAAYERLLSALRQNHLGWVADQVIQEVRLGKTAQKQVDTLRESRRGGVSSSSDMRSYPKQLEKGPRATFPVTEAYTSAERLALVLDAIEQAVINTAEMETELFKHLRAESGAFETIAFSPEEGESGQIRLVHQDSLRKHEAVETLRGQLDALRRQV
jgi:hypothetical protein